MNIVELFVKHVTHGGLKVQISDLQSSCYDYMQDKIYINTQEEEFYGFMKHVQKYHLYDKAYKYSNLMWTVLHEIGHYYVNDYTEDDLTLRAYLSQLDEQDLKDSQLLQTLYFSIQNEWEATEWAIEFIEHHKLLVKIFDLFFKTI